MAQLSDYAPSISTIFKVLKAVLIVCNALVIIGSILVLISRKDFGEPEFKNHYKVLVFACLVVIGFCSLGIFAVWRQKFGLVLVYAVLMTIALVLEIAELSKEDVNSFLASGAIVLCAYLYAFLIRHYEKEEEVRRTFAHQVNKI